MKNRLELKILLLLIVVLVIGFGTYVILSISHESSILLDQQKEKAKLFSETVMVGIRNVMLSGKAPFAAEIVNDARENLTFGTLRVYNNKGKEVFPDEGRGVIADAGDMYVRRALETHEEVMFMRNDSAGQHVVRVDPLLNELQCQRCHNPDHRVRGVTRLELSPDLLIAHKQSTRIQDPKSVHRFMVELISNTLAIGFRNIMVAGEGKLMDTLVRRAAALPFIARIKVYDRFGGVHFGDEDNALDEDTITNLLERAEPEIYHESNHNIITRLIPLRNEERCQVCHGSKNPWRGVMEVTLKVNELSMDPQELEKQMTEMMQSVIGVGFRSIMLVGKGIFARSFINDVRTIGAVHDLRVFDNDDNERFVNVHTKDYGLDFVKEALQKDSTIETTQWIDGEEFLVRYATLHNERRCQVCHGDDHTIRGVVGVTSSMAGINATIHRNQLISLAAGILTILLVWLVLRIFMRAVVVRPIGSIGEVVEQVGRGNFAVFTKLKSKDEIGELARRINLMIIGLRERFHLEKFVSRETVDAVRRADEMGVKLGGERKQATVFFSDMRGFTAFSEKVDPETVVAMLNSILSRQAEIVKRYDGDIDKFVGDELVAVFQGEQMVRNALRCAIEIQRMMETIHEEVGEKIAVGIGINTGEMVMGAMGSADRMDFTVIGDAVNLGARLCSAAKPGQILVSEWAAQFISGADGITLEKMDPVTVKGKAAPVMIYEAKVKN